MTRRQVEVDTPLEELLVEQALLMARGLQAAADSAPDGSVLAEAELVVLRAGRELTRRALEAALRGQAEQAEKRGRAGPPLRQGKGGPLGAHRLWPGDAPPRASTSAARAAATAATYRTTASARAACSAPAPNTWPAWPRPAGWPFDVAADRLEGLAGVAPLGGEASRRHALAAAAQLARRRRFRGLGGFDRRRLRADARRLARAEAGPVPGASGARRRAAAPRTPRGGPRASCLGRRSRRRSRGWRAAASSPPGGAAGRRRWGQRKHPRWRWWPTGRPGSGRRRHGRRSTGCRAASSRRTPPAGWVTRDGRPRGGASMGSGAVQGLARRVGERPKVPGRGWIEQSVDPMAALVCTVQTPEWDALWHLLAA